MTDREERSLYRRLAREAEAVRWRWSDVPWHELKPERASPELRAFVRDIAASELTTFSATRKFLAEFADDVELSDWMSVWFYEETRHPHALLHWLERLGTRVDDAFVHRGRAAAPFMRSRTGTLVTNVISERVAAASYVNLARSVDEPVLVAIARNLAADEGRHASGFYTFARRAIECASAPDDERRTALKVLYLWLRDRASVAHPIGLFYDQHGQNQSPTPVPLIDARAVNVRVCRLIGTLVGKEISGPDDVAALVRALPDGPIVPSSPGEAGS